MLSSLEIVGFSLLTLASASGGETIKTCAQAPAAPIVEVRVIEERERLETDLSAKELAALETAGGNASQLKVDEDMHGGLGGLTVGNVAIEHKIFFQTRNDKRNGFGCVSFQLVEVVLRLSPAIYIASDYQRDPCMYREISNHEMLHVAADRQIVAKYKSRIRDGLSMLFSEPADYASGVITAADMPRKQAQMERTMTDAIGVLFADLQEEREIVQARVDSPYEYSRIKRACR